MRILYLTDVFSNKVAGGESKIAWEYVNSLSRQGVNVWVMASYVDYDKEKLDKRVKVVRAPFGFREPNFSVSNMFKCFIFSLPIVYFKNIDLIHVGPNSRIFPYTKFKVRPLVMESFSDLDYGNEKLRDDLMYDRGKKEEELGYEVKRGLIEKIWRKLAHWFFILFGIYKPWSEKADAYFCHSKDLIDFLRKSGVKSKIFYHPNGIRKDFFKEKLYDIKSNKVKFLFVGHVSKRKGVGYLIRAFNRLSRKYNNLELNLLGGGAPSTIEIMKKEVSVSGNNIVNFIGGVLPEKINKFYMENDVFVLPSLSETFGMVNIEAMASGKPVISTRVGGIVDYLEDGKFGYLVNPADEDDLYNKMEIFIKNPNRILEMGRGARKYAIERFDWDSLTRRAILFYKELV